MNEFWLVNRNYNVFLRLNFWYSLVFNANYGGTKQKYAYKI